MELTQQLVSRQRECVQLVADRRKYRLETVQLSSVERSLGVVGVQKMAEKQPVEVVEVVHSVIALTLTSDALKYKKAKLWQR